MAPLVCPSCRRSNPDFAVFCYFDGSTLKGEPGARAPGANQQLAREFYFPSGRRCKTLDELVQGCQEEWMSARDMLKKGMFAQYFSSLGRMDFVKASQEAQAQTNPDIALTTFLHALPASAKLQGPKLDLSPRKLDLGRIRAGETREIQLRILNRGQGNLQGSVSIVEGEEWLRLGDGSASQLSIQTPREQVIHLSVDTRGLPSAQTYGAKLRVVTNGGVDEVPIQMDVAAHAFPRPPFQGARTPREMAIKMRDNAKAAGQLLESGELANWFASNGWNYPVGGQPARGVAGVQQFFEAMGLSKPPVVKLSQPAIRLLCTYPERPQFQISLFTQSRKYVYANVASEAPWLKVLSPSVSGAQKANIAFEIDPRALPPGNIAQGLVQVAANGGQKLPLRVMVDIRRPALSVGRQLFQPLVTLALMLLLVRLLLAPCADFYARSAAVQFASTRATFSQVRENSPARSMAGWLRLPWYSVLMKTQIGWPKSFFGEGVSPPVNAEDFRDYFVGTFVRIMVFCMWWIGAVAGGWILWRRHGWRDGIWGVVSGAIFGMVAAATLSCVMLLVDLFPLILWNLIFGETGASLGLVFVWVLFAVIWWALLGMTLGLVLTALGPVGKAILTPIQESAAGLFRFCGLRRLARFCAAQ